MSRQIGSTVLNLLGGLCLAARSYVHIVSENSSLTSLLGLLSEFLHHRQQSAIINYDIFSRPRHDR